MGKVYEVLVDKNEDIRSKISDFMLEKGWNNAYISGAIGSVRDVEFTTPISMELPPKVNTAVCTGPGEVLTFTGEIMDRKLMDPALKGIYKDTTSPLFIHIHAAVAVSGGHVYGGGLQSGKAFRALKVYIQKQD